MWGCWVLGLLEHGDDLVGAIACYSRGSGRDSRYHLLPVTTSKVRHYLACRLSKLGCHLLPGSLFMYFSLIPLFLLCSSDGITMYHPRSSPVSLARLEEIWTHSLYHGWIGASVYVRWKAVSRSKSPGSAATEVHEGHLRL